MATLQIKKKSLRTWEHIDSQLGMFILSKFYFSADGTKFQVVEQGQAKRRIYDISDIEVFDVGGSAETFGTITALSIRLEDLKYPAYNLGGVFEFDPADYDLEEFNNNGADPYVKVSEITEPQIIMSHTNITSADLITQDVYGIVSYINSLALSFDVTSTEIKRFVVTDTGQIFELQLNDRSFGGSEPDIFITDVLEIKRGKRDQMYKSWFSYMANNAGAILIVNTNNTLTVSGTNTVVSRGGTTFYNSLIMNNYLSATPAGSNAGIKNNNAADGSYLEGVDASFVFINNDANNQCCTAVGLYSSLAAIPNQDPTSFTASTVLVGNDVGDTNLSFFINRPAATANFIKIPCGANFPANTTTDAYVFRIEIPKTLVEANRYGILTITNIVTGAVFSTVVTGAQLPAGSANFVVVINRGNRATGVATNIRAAKIHVTRLIY